jgi:outer membrane protein, adhesin transport system
MRFSSSFQSFLKALRLVIPLSMLAASLPANALTLQDAIKDMLANNPDVQAARQEMLAREHEIRGAKAGYLPTLDAEAGIGREWTRSPSTSNASRTLTREEAALRLRQTVYDGGTTGNEVDRQRARYKSALFTAIDTQENAALRASQAYVNVLRHAELLALLKQSLDEHQTIFDQTSLREERGVGSQADVDQITVRLSLATSNFIAGKNNFLDALSQFQGLVGYIPDASQMETPAGLVLPSSLDESLNVAFSKHPTIKSATADVEAAEAQYEASKSKYHPKVTLEGDRTWNEDIDGVEGRNEDWVVALRVRYNLYNGGKDSARRKQTAELMTRAKDVLRGAQWETEEGMRLSWYAYEATQQQLGHLVRHVESVESTKKAYVQQYDIGRRTLLDLLNTESELIQAKQTYTNTRFDQLFSQIRVLNSSGQLTEGLGLK